MAVLSSPIKSTSSLARKQKTEGKVKGADSVLKASSKKLQLPENDDTPVTVTKVNKIVETKVKRLQPKITKKVRSAIKPFDPNFMIICSQLVIFIRFLLIDSNPDSLSLKAILFSLNFT